MLTGCETVRSNQCPPVVPYSRAFMDRAAAELQLLPAGGAIEEMLKDYSTTRDQLRACR